MNFETMTDTELENSLKSNVASERKILHVILEHIREVDARQLHLKRAFPSLKAYLIEENGYSGSAADRRIEAAQLIKDVPAVAEKVRDGILNLSQLGEVHKAVKTKERISRCNITPEEKHTLVESVIGKTVYQAQQELAQMLDIPVRKCERIYFQQDGSAIIETYLSKETFEKLMRCKESTAHRLVQNNQEINLANTIDRLAEEHLEKKFNSATSASKTAVVPERVNKTLTPKTRALVLNQDACCSFRDSRTGKVCGSRFVLQTDHKQSRWLGGDHSLRNLQPLCARHNRFKYQQEKLVELRFFG